MTISSGCRSDFRSCPVDDDGRLTPTADLPREQQLPEALVGNRPWRRTTGPRPTRRCFRLVGGEGGLAFREEYRHSYPHCWRSKTPIIFRAVDQWFICVDHVQAGSEATFRARALEAIRGVNWVPDWGRNRIEGAVTTRPDWCISGSGPGGSHSRIL